MVDSGCQLWHRRPHSARSSSGSKYTFSPICPPHACRPARHGARGHQHAASSGGGDYLYKVQIPAFRVIQSASGQFPPGSHQCGTGDFTPPHWNTGMMSWIQITFRVLSSCFQNGAQNHSLVLFPHTVQSLLSPGRGKDVILTEGKHGTSCPPLRSLQPGRKGTGWGVTLREYLPRRYEVSYSRTFPTFYSHFIFFC